MSDLAIQAEGLGKRYRLGESGYATLRETLARMRTPSAPDRDAREVWALRDLDLSIECGDVVGIIGRNGAGKTTLLKTVARIVRPTTGVVRARGRVGALLEVGTGFHLELTGRENVYLNGVILGMSRREVRRRFDDIVEFAGVERFLETPLKRYSSGMYLRLAFAVAAHIDPDILIVDEVLAVGDAEFRRRCLGRMSEFGREGRTVLFVSHDSAAVAQLCRSAIWLENGRIRDVGDARNVIDAYLATTVGRGTRVAVDLSATTPIRALSVALVDADSNPIGSQRRDEPLRFDVSFTLEQPVPRFDLALYVLTSDRVQVLSENISDRQVDIRGAGEFRLRLTVSPCLVAGDYVAGIWIGSEHGTLVWEEVLAFALVPRPDDSAESLRRRRIVETGAVWDVEVAVGSG